MKTDGEGHISINRVRSKSAHREGSWTANFNVGGTDEQTIKWIALTFGGRYSRTANSVSFSNRKDMHHCYWDYTSSLKLLPKVLPYLKTKRLQAYYLLEFIQACTSIVTYPDRKRAARLAALCAAVNDHTSRWRGTGE